MSEEVNTKRKRRKSSRILDDSKLAEIERNFRLEEKKNECHRERDMEEIRTLDRFERRLYCNTRRMKMRSKADSARAKWKGLRDTFRGELKKVNKTVASGTNCQSTNWEYFDEMVFVKDQIYSNKRSLAHILQSQHRRGPSTAEPSLEESNAVVEVPVTCRVQVNEENEDTLGGSEEEPAPFRIVPQPSFPPPQVHATATASDDDYNFLMSILPHLRNLPTLRNLFVRLKIQELLYNEIVSLQDNNLL